MAGEYRQHGHITIFKKKNCFIECNLRCTVVTALQKVSKAGGCKGSSPLKMKGKMMTITEIFWWTCDEFYITVAAMVIFYFHNFLNITEYKFLHEHISLFA